MRTHGAKDLHFYFDARTDVADDDQNAFADIDKLASALLSAGFTPPTGPGHDTVEDWAHESFVLARQKAYRGLGDVSKKLDEFPVGYEADARAVTRQRVAEAGARLAQVLEELFPER
jgi:hypothetical protein